MAKFFAGAALAAAGFALGANALAQETIRIGAPLPITGPLAPEAVKQQRGYDLWAEQVNKAGGINVLPILEQLTARGRSPSPP